MRAILFAGAVTAAFSLAACRERPPLGHPPDGVCATAKQISLDQIRGRTLSPGTYVFQAGRGTIVDVELASGGGGGGATSDVHTVDPKTGFEGARTGAGGRAGKYGYGHYPLDSGWYLLAVGAGGAGGVSPPLGQDAPPGQGGGDTTLARCASGLPLVSLDGGTGGPGDGNPNRDRGGNGEAGPKSLGQPSLGAGGAGGIWQANGGDGGGNASGGGGQGGTNKPGRHGGRGADGFARLTGVGR